MFKGNKHLLVEPLNGKQIKAKTHLPFKFSAERFGMDSFGIKKVNQNSSLPLKKSSESYKHETWQYNHKIYSKTL